MYELDQKYIDKLEEIAAEIQESDELEKYLETEEDEDYLLLKEMYEPKLAEVHEEVAKQDPLQLIPLELVVLDPAFEGLFLPKILGYSVLRGEFNEDYKYVRPQEHFKEVLLAICNSANFEILKKRIGQSIQIGFALSSDIWITNLINSIANKRVRYYLQAQKLERYRRAKEREIGYARYKQQFRHDLYHTATFPTTQNELSVEFSSLKHFLIHRINLKLDNSSIMEPLKDFIANETFKGTPEHLQIMSLYAKFFDLNEADMAHLKQHFNETRQKMPDFVEHYLEFHLENLEGDEIAWTPEADKRITEILDRSIKDDLTDYYDLMDTIHGKGYTNAEVQEAIKTFYERYEGLSTINECVRYTIFYYFNQVISNLEVDQYTDYFEITKLFPVYMDIFMNQKFNQNLEKASKKYLKKLLKHYTDKRGKDYQDIKKFVAATFVDFGFMTEKEVVETFKTRRKKKKKTTES
jgi:hypothetical protein